MANSVGVIAVQPKHGEAIGSLANADCASRGNDDRNDAGLAKKIERGR
jgi:hypothetical protein